MGITITEALAEIKTINKRIGKKQEFVLGNLARAEGVKDPLANNGGSPAVITAERQSISDLQNRIIALRRGIQRANDTTRVVINGVDFTISEWLTWRRDVAPSHKAFLEKSRASLNTLRDQIKRQGHALVPANAVSADTRPTDVVINIDEKRLADEIEALEDTLGTLDGQLSLKNATVTVEI